MSLEGFVNSRPGNIVLSEEQSSTDIDVTLILTMCLS
jgi:hypothetical protein